jgi:nitrite reductase/ring-hydroxylating ferredoxin subunit
MFAVADPEDAAARDASYPEGWFAVALSRELGLDKAIPRRAFGRDLVLWRTADGVAHAADAECPHYRVHMGRGGTVKDDGLACPIHGLRFDREGLCLPAHPGKPAPALSIRIYPVREAMGVIFAWRDLAQAPPGAQAPAPADEPAASEPWRWRLDGGWELAAAKVAQLASEPGSGVRLYATPVEPDASEVVAVELAPRTNQDVLARLEAALGAPEPAGAAPAPAPILSVL